MRQNFCDRTFATELLRQNFCDRTFATELLRQNNATQWVHPQASSPRNRQQSSPLERSASASRRKVCPRLGQRKRLLTTPAGYEVARRATPTACRSPRIRTPSARRRTRTLACSMRRARRRSGFRLRRTRSCSQTSTTLCSGRRIMSRRCRSPNCRASPHFRRSRLPARRPRVFVGSAFRS